MLRWVYKSGTFLQFTMYAVFMALLWIPAFVNPVPPVSTLSDGPLYSLFLSWLQPFGLLPVATGLFLIVLQSVVLFYIYQSNGFFGRSNFLPAIIILMAYSWNPDYLTMHAMLPAGIFCIIALNSILSMYGQQDAYHQVFTAGLAIGIASLFYVPLAFLLLLIWFTFITYRISTWREYAISVISFSLPFLYFISWLFWNDTLADGFNQFYNSLFNLILPPRIPLIPTIWLFSSAFIIIVGMLAVLNSINDKVISIRRRVWVMFNFSFTALIGILLAGWPILSANYIFVIPMSFYLTGSLVLKKRTFWFEILAIVYFLLFIALRIYEAL